MKRLFVLVLVVAALAPSVSRAEPNGPGAGISLTLQVPDTFDPGALTPVNGRMLAFATVVLEEASAPLPFQDVQVAVDGVVMKTIQTGLDGGYSTTIVFSDQPPTTHVLQAIALAGTPIEVRSAESKTNIDQAWANLSVSPSSATLAPGGEIQLHATADDQNGRTHDVTDKATWSSSDNAVATVSVNGLVTGVAPGAATITAKLGGLQASASITVG